MSILYQPLRINGVVSTDKSVLQNLNDLCTASGCWLTYDYSVGKWSVIINRPDSVVAAFTDSNIIGNLDVNGTGVNELYNSVSIEFPHKDIRDEKDYIELEIPSGDRFPNEVDNTLNIQSDLVNDPVQAQYLANVELKQSRVDKIVEFRTDYSRIGLKAGDIISISNTAYNFTNKLFRIIKVVEEDGDGLNIAITALEYSADIYNTGGLVRVERTKNTGIILRSSNPAVKASDDFNWGSQLLRMMVPLVGTSLLNMLFRRNPITGAIDSILNPAEGINDNILVGLGTLTVNSLTATSYVCEGGTITVSAVACRPNCANFSIVKAPYEITGVTTDDIGIPLKGEVTFNATGTATLSIPVLNPGLTASKTLTITIAGKTATSSINPGQDFTYNINTSATTIVEGESVTFTVITSNVDDGTEIPWTVSGASISSPESGTLTITGNTATVTVVTTDVDAIVNRSLSFSIDPGVTLCPGSTSQFSRSVTVTYTGTPPAPDVTGCTYVSIPIAWCGTFSSTGVLKTVTPSSYMNVLASTLGGSASVTVPTSVTVTDGVISISSSVSVDNTPGKGGRPANVITSFGAPVGKIIVGTTTQLVGY